ncbi:unnamed protein product [Caenorhabditis auriculariae]|uniref:CUT domain-containing protein n=1 Tax=Caenorhabditis auriculariae TaxID=2777116 RepID=A0A8S1HXL5_9PELO|nr:unnamed protein product [Caenorhabditis auriculariae]
MEGLETGLTSDPLLSAALTSPPAPSRIVVDGSGSRTSGRLRGTRVSSDSSQHDDHSFLDFGADDDHPHHAATIYGNYATLTTLQPLPPISTVTSKEDRYTRSTPSPQRDRSTSINNYFYTPTNQSSYNYNVNIKYEYDSKQEEDEDDAGLAPASSTPSDYGSSGAQDLPFSAPSYVSSYNGSPKLDKDCFGFAYTNEECDDSEESVKKESPSMMSGSLDGDCDDDGEELNTKDLAVRISAELKRYSIPQAIFAQRVLCRSQGTLSDLLRNPKPWSKLKSGRETFRRMAKWLEEPEFQRMSALRLAEKGQMAPSREVSESAADVSAPNKGLASKVLTVSELCRADPSVSRAKSKSLGQSSVENTYDIHSVVEAGVRKVATDATEPRPSHSLATSIAACLGSTFEVVVAAPDGLSTCCLTHDATPEELRGAEPDDVLPHANTRCCPEKAIDERSGKSTAPGGVSTRSEAEAPAEPPPFRGKNGDGNTRQDCSWRIEGPTHRVRTDLLGDF